MTYERSELQKMLYEQATKCQTVNGGSLLLSILAHIEGRQLFEGMDELWQVADHIANNLQSNPSTPAP